VTKAAGTRILIDRIHVDLVTEAFEANHSAAQSMGAGTNTVKWDQEVFDYGGAYDPGAGSFTAIEPGFHRFHAFVQMTAGITNALTGAQLTCKVGGVQRLFSSYAPGSGTTVAALWLHTFPIRLDRGDVVTFDLTLPTTCNVDGTVMGGRTPQTER